MLLDTGVGARAYSIVEQGQVESFIMSKPEEKRKFIEEVAGIEKYKLRRKETRSRIESTRENLSRVLDMKREVSDRIEAVALQAKRARQYEELTGRARSLEFDVLSAKLSGSQQRKEALLEKKLAAEQFVRSADAELGAKARTASRGEGEKFRFQARIWVPLRRRSTSFGRRKGKTSTAGRRSNGRPPVFQAT